MTSKEAGVGRASSLIVFMSTEKAAEIVRQAMADRSIYDAMAARENEFWGKILPERERSETAVADMKAGAELRVNRHLSSLSTLAKEKELKFEHGLTLGCGAGRRERELVQNGVCQAFHGIDISENAIGTARETCLRSGSDMPSSHSFSRAGRGTSMALAKEQWVSLDS